MLQEVGIPRASVYLTNLLLDRPPNNDLTKWCVSKAELPSDYPHPPIKPGKYLEPERLKELDRLRGELLKVSPNLVIALGNTACWALLNSTGVKKLRGTTAVSTLVFGQKVLPTYHPAYILRDWNRRGVVIADLYKAKNEAKFPEVRRPQRFIWIEPTLAEMYRFYRLYISGASKLSVDVETKKGQITCIGFAPSKEHALVVPFVDERKENYSYWPTAREERLAWLFVKKMLALPITKIGQNFLYDIQYLWRAHGLTVGGEIEDTMLLHHALQPMMEKDLGFLGSIYTSEPAWKLMRHTKTEKREE
jgi:uracil-DNA glycosylase